jgi:hypothetical protein
LLRDNSEQRSSRVLGGRNLKRQETLTINQSFVGVCRMSAEGDYDVECILFKPRNKRLAVTDSTTFCKEYVYQISWKSEKF